MEPSVAIFDPVKDVIPAVTLDKVVITSNKIHVHRPRVGGIVLLEGVQQCLKGGSRYGDIVSVLDITLVLGVGVARRGKEIVKGGIRDHNFRSFVWVT